MTPASERSIAYALLRLTLGVNLFGHGFIRILHGPGNFAAGMVKSMADTPLPHNFVYGFGLLTPFVEITLGVLLILGLATRVSLIAASLFMSALMLGITFKQDWPTAGLQLVYAAVIALLLFLRPDYDRSWPALLRPATKRV